MMSGDTHITRLGLSSSTAKRRLAPVVGSAAALSLILTACGDGGNGDDGADYPTESIEYIIPYDPGGGADPAGREFADALAEELDTGNEVRNIPGGDESLGIAQMAGADPDGYTLGMGTSGGFVAQPLANDDVAYEWQDMTPLARMTATPYGLFVAADSEYETLEDLLEAAEADPGNISISSPTGMGNPAFAVYLLEEQAGVSFNLITTAGGTGEAALEVMSGRIDAVIGNASGQLGLVESGDLRAVAYSGDADYSAFLPDAVSFESAGYDIPFTSDYMTFAPGGLPEEVESTLRETSEAILTSEDWATWAENQGALANIAVGDELDEYLENITENVERGIELGESRGGN